jgi:hypothetical protein
MGNLPGGTVRGTPQSRSIIAWLCILSVVFSGCAANRVATAPPEVEPLRALAVTPIDVPPEINVIRMGNSRVLGALQGAGRGFLGGVSSVAQGGSGMSCHGEGCIALAAVWIALMVSVGTVGAVIGGVKGARVAAPYERVSAADDATRDRLMSLRLQEGIARRIRQEAARRLGIPVSLKEHAEGDAGIDSVLRVGIARVGFEGPVGDERPLSLAVTLRAEIVRTADGKAVFGYTSEHRSPPLPPGEWARDDFLRLKEETDAGIRHLAEQCVERILDSGLVPLP